MLQLQSSKVSHIEFSMFNYYNWRTITKRFQLCVSYPWFKKTNWF